MDKQTCFVSQGQTSLAKLLKGSFHGLGPCHQNDIPPRIKPILMKAIDLPEAATNPVADMGLSQLFAYRNAQTVDPLPIFSGIENQIAVGKAFCVVKPLENVIQF
jgi:hypothetical protein